MSYPRRWRILKAPDGTIYARPAGAPVHAEWRHVASFSLPRRLRACSRTVSGPILELFDRARG